MRRERVARSVADPTRPRSLMTLAARYREHLTVRAFAPAVVNRRERDLMRFVAWCEDRGIRTIDEVDRVAVVGYQRWTATQIDQYGKPLSLHAQRYRLEPVCWFAEWLERSEVIAASPAADIVLPREPRRPPRVVLSPETIERLIATANIATPTGLRNRALYETLYSTGLRRSEVAALSTADVQASHGWVRVREGKGRLDRMVPIGRRAMTWIEAYIRDARPTFAAAARIPGDDLWLNENGTPLGAIGVYEVVRDGLDRVGVGKVGACHLVRHAMATHLLDAGAGVEAIGAMLGHRDLRTTPVYTHVCIETLTAHLAAVRARLGLVAPRGEAAS